MRRWRWEHAGSARTYLEEADAHEEYYYFDDSYADYYQRFPRPSLDAMARMVLATKNKNTKKSVELLVYQTLR